MGWGRSPRDKKIGYGCYEGRERTNGVKLIGKSGGQTGREGGRKD